MMTNEEEWRLVVGYPAYEVSNYGRVRRSGKRSMPGPRPTGPDGTIRPNIQKDGYRSIGLCGDAGLKRRKVHSLVAEAFIGPRGVGIEVNHIDGVKSNNRLDNLEYVTSSGNQQHAISLGLVPVLLGEDRPNAKLTAAQAFEIFTCGGRQDEVAARFGVSQGTVTNIRTGKAWNHVTGLPNRRKDRSRPSLLSKSTVSRQ